MILPVGNNNIHKTLALALEPNSLGITMATNHRAAHLCQALQLSSPHLETPS